MSADRLLQSLARVDAQRLRRREDGRLAEQVVRLKAFQQARLRLTYPDLLSHPTWGPAAHFFLEELYGPQDFAQRDKGLARVVPTLVRLFPRDVVATVDRLLQLHALSEELDSAMAEASAGDPSVAADATWTGERYGRSWRSVDRRADREWQIVTVVELGSQLDRLTRLPGLRQSLRLMRGPAQLSGLGALQSFLERGFDAFRAMGGAGRFLAVIDERERLWLEWLFSGRARHSEDPVWLGQFP